MERESEGWAVALLHSSGVTVDSANSISIYIMLGSRRFSVNSVFFFCQCCFAAISVYRILVRRECDLHEF